MKMKCIDLQGISQEGHWENIDLNAVLLHYVPYIFQKSLIKGIFHEIFVGNMCLKITSSVGKLFLTEKRCFGYCCSFGSLKGLLPYLLY